jgi:hypothetical protein
VLGPTEAAAAYLQASREAVAANRDVPLAQALLMWVARHAPGESERVLGAARAHYAQA